MPGTVCRQACLKTEIQQSTTPGSPLFSSEKKSLSLNLRLADLARRPGQPSKPQQSCVYLPGAEVVGPCQHTQTKPRVFKAQIREWLSGWSPGLRQCRKPWVWWHMTILMARGRQKQEDLQFKAAWATLPFFLHFCLCELHSFLSPTYKPKSRVRSVALSVSWRLAGHLSADD